MDGISLISGLLDAQKLRHSHLIPDDDLQAAIERAGANAGPPRAIRTESADGLARVLEVVAARFREEVARFGVTHV